MATAPLRVNRFLREARPAPLYPEEQDDDMSDYEEPPPPYETYDNPERFVHFGVDPLNSSRFILHGSVADYDQRDKMVLNVLLEFAAYLRNDGFTGRVSGLVLLQPHGGFEIVVHTLTRREYADGRLTFV